MILGDMEETLGLLRVHVKRGINLAIRDARTSDPYCILTFGNQKLKTKVVNGNCNPEWNDALDLIIKTSSISDPINLTVYDKDMFTRDDEMGDAEIEIQTYMDTVRTSKEKEMRGLPAGCALKRIQPKRSNSLAEESSIVWNNGKITQEMILRLKHVECGEVVVQLEWIHLPSSPAASSPPRPGNVVVDAPLLPETPTSFNYKSARLAAKKSTWSPAAHESP